MVFDQKKSDGEFEDGFWHLITRGSPDRTFDPARARKLSWIDYLLLDDTDGVSKWIYLPGDARLKVYFWLEEHDYVLILQETKSVMAVVTAHHLDQEWAKRDLEKKRAKGAAF